MDTIHEISLLTMISWYIRKRKALTALVGLLGLVPMLSVIRDLSSISASWMMQYDGILSENGHRRTLATEYTQNVSMYDGALSPADLTIAKAVVGYNYSFDPAEITHVYHLGLKRAYGQSNNRLISILHTIDIALDKHGDLPNNHAVVAISDWAYEIIKGLFYSGNNDTEFPVQLEQLRPLLLVHDDRLEALGLKENKTHVYLNGKDSYHHVKNNRQRLTPQIIKNRRQAVLGSFLQHGIAGRNLVLYNAVKDNIDAKSRIYGNKTNERIKYVTIHSRWLEGQCERRVGSLLPKDECWMTPSYIKEIMGGSIDRPIVLIGDGENKEVIEKLKRDPDIGPALIIPNDVVPDNVEVLWWTQPWSDMMIAVMSDTFVGTRVSSFATMVGIFRVVRGADPASNFIYTSRENSTSKERPSIEICEDCLFLCDTDESILCGEKVIYS